MEDNIRTEIINSIINGDIDHASELVETHKPEYLYKYRSGSDYDLDALRKKSIWISRAKSTQRLNWYWVLFCLEYSLFQGMLLLNRKI